MKVVKMPDINIRICLKYRACGIFCKELLLSGAGKYVFSGSELL